MWIVAKATDMEHIVREDGKDARQEAYGVSITWAQEQVRRMAVDKGERAEVAVPGFLRLVQSGLIGHTAKRQSESL